MVHANETPPRAAPQRDPDPYASAIAAARCCDACCCDGDVQALAEWLHDNAPAREAGPCQ